MASFLPENHFSLSIIDYTNVLCDRRFSLSLLSILPAFYQGQRNVHIGVVQQFFQGSFAARLERKALHLLKQLEQTAPAESTADKMVIAAQAIEHTEAHPTFKQKVVTALTAGSLKSFEAAIDHPLAAFVVGAIEGWKDPK